jgi:hypothetical protein
MSLVRLCDSIAAEPSSQDRGDQGGEPDPRTSRIRVGHISLQRKPAHTYWLDHIGDFGPP